MNNRGLWRKEIIAGRFKFILSVMVFVMAGALIPLVYDYTIKLVDNLPIPGFAKGQIALFKDYKYFIWSQWYGKNLLQMASILAIIFGSGLVSSEVSGKTISFLLTKPIARHTVFRIKFVTDLVYLILVLTLSTMILYLSIVLTGHHYPIMQIVQFTAVFAAGVAVIFSLAAYVSTVFDQFIRSLLTTCVVALVLAIPGYFSAVQQLSIYHQMRGIGIFAGQGFPYVPFTVLLIISFVIYWLGQNRFVKRDL